MGIKITDGCRSDVVDIDELLSIKSLVLANDAAKQELHRQAVSSGEVIAGDNIASTGIAHNSIFPTKCIASTARGATSKQDQSQHKSVSAKRANEQLEAPLICETGPSPYWSQIDRLEFAAQKLELAKWEHNRVEENIVLGRPGGSDVTEARQKLLMDRIHHDLLKFGMREELVRAAISALSMSRTSSAAERTAVFPLSPSTSELLDILRAR